MPLEKEPIAETVERGDKSVQWSWTGSAFAGPYDPGAYCVERAGDRHRGQRMAVAAMPGPDGAPGSIITVWFDIQPASGDLITAPAISDFSE